MIKHVAHLVPVLVVTTLGSTAIWANWIGWLPPWALFVVATCLLLAVVLAFRSSTPDRLDEDPLGPWLHYRVAKATAWTAESGEECTLVLDLVTEKGVAAPGVTLRFHGVARLMMRQFGTHDLLFDGLTWQDRGTRRRRRKRLEVQDGWGDGIAFTYHSFEQVRWDTAKGGYVTCPTGRWTPRSLRSRGAAASVGKPVAPLEQRCVVYRMFDTWFVASCAMHKDRWRCTGFDRTVSLDESLGDLGRVVETSLVASGGTRNLVVGVGLREAMRGAAERASAGRGAVTVARMAGIVTIVAGEALGSPRPIASQVESGDLVELVAAAQGDDLGARIRSILGTIE